MDAPSLQSFVPAELLYGREKVVPDAVATFADGNFVLVMDDFDRENECDLIILGETVTAAQMAFMIKHSTGIVCVVADKPRLEKMGLYPAARDNTDKNATNFYVATDYLPTTTTGVSARDRSETVRAFCREESKAEDFSKPGHMFPLCPRSGGVLERGGHTESAYDLCRLAGKQTVAAIGELMREDGEMMRLEECVDFSKKHRIPLITVEELRQWIKQNGASPIADPGEACGLRFKRQNSNENASTIGGTDAPTVVCSTCTIPVRSRNFGEGMRLQMFELDDPLHIQVVAAIKGEVEGQEDVAVRIHSECFTGDVLRSAKCDCGLQLEKFFLVMEQEPSAVLLYIKGHEGRGIGLAAKFDAYRLQSEEHLDTVDSNVRLGFEPDLRSYSGISQIIQQLGIKSVRLFTNNPEKLRAVQDVLPSKHVPLRTTPLDGNRDYLKTKEKRMEHFATMVERGDEHEEQVEALVELREPIEWPKFGEYEGFRVALVATDWNKECTSQLVQGCEAVLQAAKCAVTLTSVPGALDLVSGCRATIHKECPPHAVVALGTYVRGDTETSQMQYQATVSGLQQLNVWSAVPIISGVVWCNSQEDAVKRCSADLGGSWAKNALQMISTFS
jgi:3,4-dihydroxy 2-butanone 4-phosphate synthase/GTP cyclohydrolase II